MNAKFCNECDLIGGYCGQCDGGHWDYVNTRAKIQKEYRANSLTATRLVGSLPSLGFSEKDGFFFRNIKDAVLYCNPSKSGRFTAGIRYPAGNGFGGGVSNGEASDAWYCIAPYL